MIDSYLADHPDVGEDTTAIEDECRMRFSSEAEFVADSQEAVDARPKPRLSNFEIVSASEAVDRGVVKPDEKPKDVRVPRSIQAIVDDANRITSGWPRRVGGELFVPDGFETDGITGRIDFQHKPSELFAYLGSAADSAPAYAKGGEFHTKDEVMAATLRTATRYQSVQTLPHFPPLDGSYYHHRKVENGDGSALDRLVSMMSPATEIDRQLLFAFFATLFWGGLPGKRPAFLFTTDDGVGSGKTTAAMIGGQLAGGHVAITAGESADAIKTRLLTGGTEHVRAVVLDNVKSNRLSNADLESLITEPTISGRKLYAGDARRPNTFVWCLTLNGVSLSSDIASRVVVIKVAKPKFTRDWDQQAADFVRDSKRDVIADIAAFFARQPVELDGTKLSRWAHWEGSVLGRLDSPDDILDELKRRRDESNSDCEEIDVVRQEIVDTLRRATFDPASDVVFLSPKLINSLISSALSEPRITTTASSRMAHQWIDSKTFPELYRANKNKFGRGVIWSAASDWSESQVITDIDSRLESRSKL